MANNPIPVYVFTGFLESGKTKFIKEILADPDFTENERTALLCCEEGIEEYDEKWLLHYGTALVPIESEDRLTPNILKRVEQKYQPDRILIEYNGMWKLEKLMAAFPARWELYQIVTTVDATTFEIYSNNIGPMMFEHITTADLVVFNRCTDELKAALRKRNLRMVNRRADIYLEDLEGNSEDYNNGDVCPFDLDQKVIDIPDNDYGVWYVDVMDYPDRWAGKAVHMKLLMCHSKKYPGTHCPGRFAMVCCENDVQFLGLVAKGVDLNKYKNRDWVEVEARMALENHSAYKGKGPVMHIISIKPCEKPANEVVTF